LAAVFSTGFSGRTLREAFFAGFSAGVSVCGRIDALLALSVASREEFALTRLLGNDAWAKCRAIENRPITSNAASAPKAT